VITRGQLEEALEYKRKNGGFLGQALMDLNILDQSTLTTFLVKQCKIPHLSLNDYTIDRAMAAIAPRELCEKYGMLPIDKMGKILTLAMVDPLDKEAMDAVSAAVPDLQIKPIHCDWRDFERAYQTLFPEAKAKLETNVASIADFDLPAGFNRSKKPEPKHAPVTPIEPEYDDDRVEDRSLGESLIATGEFDTPIPELEQRQHVPAAAPVATPRQEEVEELAALFERVAATLERLEAERAAVLPAMDSTGVFRVVSVTDPAESKVLQEHQLFETFVPGESNAEAVTLAERFVRNPTGAGEALLVTGAPGTGKTHLAVGIARSITTSGASAGYVSCERWATESQTGRGAVGMAAPFGVVVVDDLHRLYGHIEAQNALADLLSRLHAAGGRSIITYTAAPEAIGGFDPQLLSRLHGGIIARLELPTRSIAAAVGKQFVRRKRLDVSDAIVEGIAEAIPGDVRKLMGALLQVAVTAEMRGVAADRALAGEIVNQIAGQ
jgi:hypothetical protein